MCLVNYVGGVFPVQVLFDCESLVLIFFFLNVCSCCVMLCVSEYVNLLGVGLSNQTLKYAATSVIGKLLEVHIILVIILVGGYFQET